MMMMRLRTIIKNDNKCDDNDNDDDGVDPDDNHACTTRFTRRCNLSLYAKS